MGFGVLLVYGLVAAAVMIAATSAAAAPERHPPPQCRLSGLIVAPLLLAGFAWAPQFLVPVWC